MGIRLPDLIGDRAIVQGGSWNYEKHTGIAFPGGDWTDWTPEGQIRTNLKGVTNTLLATFTWGDPFWDETNDRSIFYPQLSATVTAGLSPTKYQEAGDPSVRNAYVYDIEISLDGVIKKGGFGYIQVIGEVTYDDV
jgi:hypothetical protein